MESTVTCNTGGEEKNARRQSRGAKIQHRASIRHAADHDDRGGVGPAVGAGQGPSTNIKQEEHGGEGAVQAHPHPPHSQQQLLQQIQDGASGAQTQSCAVRGAGDDGLLRMEWVETERGGWKLLLGGYVYVRKRRLADGWDCYECELRRNRRACSAKIKVLGTDQFREKMEHNHPPDPQSAITYRVKAGIKRKAMETNESPKQIVMAALSQAAEESAAAERMAAEQPAADRMAAGQSVTGEGNMATGVITPTGQGGAPPTSQERAPASKGRVRGEGRGVRLPGLASMQRYIRKRRQGLNRPRAFPSRGNVDDLEVSSLAGEQFVIHDSGTDDPQRFLMFTSERNLRVLSKANFWFADGSFKMFSTVFCHVCTIYAMYSEEDVVPLVYALLSNQDQDSYGRALAALREKGDFRPTSIMVDFDVAARHAFQRAFPRAEVKECPQELYEGLDERLEQLDEELL